MTDTLSPDVPTLAADTLLGAPGPRRAVRVLASREDERVALHARGPCA